MEQRKYSEKEFELRKEAQRVEHEEIKLRREADIAAAKAEARFKWWRFTITTFIAVVGAVSTFFFIDLQSHKAKLSNQMWKRQQNLLNYYLGIDKTELVQGQRLLRFMCEVTDEQYDPTFKRWACSELEKFRTWEEQLVKAEEQEKDKLEAKAIAEAQLQEAQRLQSAELATAKKQLVKATKDLEDTQAEVARLRAKLSQSTPPATKDTRAASNRHTEETKRKGPMRITDLELTDSWTPFKETYCIVSGSNVNYCFSTSLQECEDKLAKNKKTYPDSTKNDVCMARPEPLYCYLWEHTSGSIHQTCFINAKSCEVNRKQSEDYPWGAAIEPQCEEWNP